MKISMSEERMHWRMEIEGKEALLASGTRMEPEIYDGMLISVSLFDGDRYKCMWFPRCPFCKKKLVLDMWEVKNKINKWCWVSTA